MEQFFFDKFSLVDKIKFDNRTDFTDCLLTDFTDNFQFFHIPTFGVGKEIWRDKLVNFRLYRHFGETNFFLPTLPTDYGPTPPGMMLPV